MNHAHNPRIAYVYEIHMQSGSLLRHSLAEGPGDNHPIRDLRVRTAVDGCSWECDASPALPTSAASTLMILNFFNNLI